MRKRSKRLLDHKESELFPGMKHRLGRFNVADLVAKHHETKEYYEANTKSEGVR